MVSPVAGSAPGNSHEGEPDGPPPLHFQIDVTGEQATVCPAGQEEYELKDAPERVHFAGTTCVPLRSPQ